jgi:hypothetical protein
VCLHLLALIVGLLGRLPKFLRLPILLRREIVVVGILPALVLKELTKVIDFTSRDPFHHLVALHLLKLILLVLLSLEQVLESEKAVEMFHEISSEFVLTARAPAG